MKLDFQYKAFSEFSPIELYNYLQLRSEVFVVEQNCVYQDLDGQDLHAQHVLAHSNEQLIACARILPKDTNYPEISIGRVIVAPSFRGRNVGHALMKYCIEQIEIKYGKQIIVLSAQAHLQDFYKKHNFAAVGDVYLEDGIPHIKMKRKKI
ncbi:MAG: GNAT family N-acetyltransferase [Flavobacteriales bacterium]